MTLDSPEAFLTGLVDDGLRPFGDTRLLPTVAQALVALQRDAAEAGFALKVASGYRDFARQLRIWNGKLWGDRPVLDDTDKPVSMAGLPMEDQLQCVMRFSALPGASRHHWGTDVDVFDGHAMPDGYRLQLSAGEVAPDGLFGPFHAWLDERIALGESYGFYRPYGRDRGAVAPERWHLSYAPLAREYQRAITPALLRKAWDAAAPGGGLAGRESLEGQLPDLVERYVQRLDEPSDGALGFTP